MRSLALSLVALASCSSTKTLDVPYAGDAWPEPRASHVVDKSALAVVTNNASDTISLLDLKANTVVATLPVDVDPIANDGPHHAVVDANAEYVYSPLSYPAARADLGPHASHGASQVPGILVKLRAKDLARVGEVTVEYNPGDLAMTPDGKRIVVTHFDLARAIDGLKQGKPLAELRSPAVVVDVATMQRVAAPSPCIAAHGVAISKDGSKAYLACYGEDAIAVMDLGNPNSIELWPLGATTATPADLAYGPYFVVIAPSGKELVVAETEGKELRAIDLATKKTTRTFATTGAAFGPAAGADFWLVPTQGPDQVIRVSTDFADPKTRAFAAGECDKPHQIARHGDRFFLVCEGDHENNGKVLELDPTTLATVRAFDVGAYPDVIAFPEGT